MELDVTAIEHRLNLWNKLSELIHSSSWLELRLDSIVRDMYEELVEDAGLSILKKIQQKIHGEKPCEKAE